ncbi:MAG: hypothetical protein FKGGLIKP_00164 [Sodalis sp. Fse]|nr:MAG: hypothetical protein FKGGLIKP_00164 [Sodalis sp. Fse]
MCDDMFCVNISAEAKILASTHQYIANSHFIALLTYVYRLTYTAIPTPLMDLADYDKPEISIHFLTTAQECMYTILHPKRV